MALGSVVFGSGVASGINFQAIIDAIIQAQSQPINQLQSRIDRFERAKSSFSRLDSLLADFESKLKSIKSDDKVGGKRAALSDGDAPLTVSATSASATGTYSIEVSETAAAHRVRSEGLSDRYSPLVSDGTITIQAAGEETITVDVSATNGNKTLQAIADAINGEDKGVQASVIYNGSEYLLVVKSAKTGTANALTISDTTNLNLTDPENELQAARNAVLTIDGIEIESQSNSVTTAIPGVTLEIGGKTSAPVTLSVSEDIESTKATIRSFVDAYNEINQYFLDQFGSKDAEQYSAVSSQSSVRTIQRQLQDLLTGGITGIADGQLGTLAELGIQIADQTGKLEFVESRFDDLVDQGRYDEVKAVFLSSGSASNAAVRFVGSGSSTIAGVYAVTVTQAAERADLNGSNAITALGQDENLTIALNGGSATVALTAGDDVDTVVSKINTELNRQGVEAAAYADVNGVLHLRAADYGSAYTLTVVSDVAAAAGTTTGFGTTLQEDTGVDVAGQIDGVDAVGDGQVLTAGSGTDAQGLMVQIYATAESVAANGGNFGTVGYSQGAADRFLDALDGMRDPLEGTIQSVQKGYDESIKVAKERIDAMQLTLAMRRETLVRQFSAAEAAISQLQAMMASLQGAF